MDVCLFGKALSKLAQDHHVELENVRTEASAVLERAVMAKDEEIATLKVNPTRKCNSCTQYWSHVFACYKIASPTRYKVPCLILLLNVAYLL